MLWRAVLGLVSDVLSVDTMMAALREYSLGKGGSENGALGTAISLGAFRCVCSGGQIPRNVRDPSRTCGGLYLCTYLDNICTKYSSRSCVVVCNSISVSISSPSSAH